MAWFAIHDVNGALVSVCQVVSSPLPNGLTSIAINGPPTSDQTWDSGTKTFAARPAQVKIDRLDDLAADADFLAAWQALTAAQRTRLRTAVIRLLGGRRFRFPNEPFSVDNT